MLTITTSFWCFLFSFVSVTLPLTLQFFVKHILYLGLLCKTLYHIFHYILNGSHFFGRFSIFCCIFCSSMDDANHNLAIFPRSPYMTDDAVNKMYFSFFATLARKSYVFLLRKLAQRKNLLKECLS